MSAFFDDCKNALLSVGKDKIKDFLHATSNKKPTLHENMTDEEEKNFMNSVENRIALAGGKAKSPSDVVTCIKTFTDVAGDVMKFTEIQKTKRVQIRANTEVLIKQIDTVRDTIQSYLDKSFDERRYLFAKEFDLVDKALDTGNTILLEQALASITALAKESPFKGLADFAKAQKELGNPQTIIDI